MRTALVTGGAGFVARGLIPVLAARGWRVRTTARRKEELATLPPGAEGLLTGNLDSRTDWGPLLHGAEAVVHLAARVHRMHDARGSDGDYERENVELTRSLAAASARAGVRRFLFLSSIKAMGEATPPGRAWDESSPCLPQDAYGRSKLEAEKALAAEASASGLGVVVFRMPLVYGPGVKANMARLFKAVSGGLPLPLGAVSNARSLLYSGNLADAAAAVLERPEARQGTFLVSDGEDLSTPELVRRIARALGRSARLWPAPGILLRWAGRLYGRGETRRLLDSLVVDSGKIRRELGWKPPFSVDEGLGRTARWFHEAGF